MQKAEIIFAETIRQKKNTWFNQVSAKTQRLMTNLDKVAPSF
jgi:hypothetical protein